MTIMSSVELLFSWIWICFIMIKFTSLTLLCSCLLMWNRFETICLVCKYMWLDWWHHASSSSQWHLFNTEAPPPLWNPANLFSMHWECCWFIKYSVNNGNPEMCLRWIRPLKLTNINNAFELCITSWIFMHVIFLSGSIYDIIHKWCKCCEKARIMSRLANMFDTSRTIMRQIEREVK